MLASYDSWKNDLQRAISHLFDLEFRLQQTPTVAEHSTSFFHQALRHLYHDCRFPDFLALAAWRQAGLSVAAGEALQTLKNLLDNFDEPETVTAFLADPHWHAIRQQAGTTLALLR